MQLTKDIQLISAPSILGLKPTGVEKLAESFLAGGLSTAIKATLPVISVPALNSLYHRERDPETNCLNAKPIRAFSIVLGKVVAETIQSNRFAMVLGGDCSILLGIMAGLKSKGTYGLIFLDAHADFYEPEKSLSGEAADMDLALVTGRGPELLTNINDAKPYVKDENVIHIGQRDLEETKKYGSQNIQDTAIPCWSFSKIEKAGMEKVVAQTLSRLYQLKVDGFWIHFDTDVLADEINPAVDYRLPGGLLFDQVELLLGSLLGSGKMAGMSISIYNPNLDKDAVVSKNIIQSLGKTFQGFEKESLKSI
jgi:arginase